jgi:CHASE1-domain containing sensor protein
MRPVLARATVLRSLLGPQARWLRWRGLPLLVLLAALGLTGAYWLRERGEERSSQHEAFDSALREASQQTLLRLAAHEHLLQGVQGFLSATPQADAPALRRYVEALPLGADFAGLQGIALARRSPGGTGELEGRVILQQIEPAVARNIGALGRDLWLQPPLRRALEQAEDSGRTALSAKLDLRQLQLGLQPGFVLALPVYRDGVPEAVDARRASLQAWVLAPMVASELMASLYEQLPPGLTLKLYDGLQLEEAALLYRDGSRANQVSRANMQSDSPALAGREYLVVGGHTWTLALEAAPNSPPARASTRRTSCSGWVACWACCWRCWPGCWPRPVSAPRRWPSG